MVDNSEYVTEIIDVPNVITSEVTQSGGSDQLGSNVEIMELPDHMSD